MIQLHKSAEMKAKSFECIWSKVFIVQSQGSDVPKTIPDGFE
jgi:hypothetical protein